MVQVLLLLPVSAVRVLPPLHPFSSTSSWFVSFLTEEESSALEPVILALVAVRSDMDLVIESKVLFFATAAMAKVSKNSPRSQAPTLSSPPPSIN